MIAKDVAEHFIAEAKKSGETLTNEKLQCLLYYAQGFHLAMQGEPLFPEEFYAWDCGPVIPSVWRWYRIRRVMTFLKEQFLAVCGFLFACALSPFMNVRER